MKKMKMFPIQTRDELPFPRQIPWADAERAYGVYSARYGTDQSLERLAERAGFGVAEFIVFFYGLEDTKTWPSDDVIAKHHAMYLERIDYLTKLRERVEIAHRALWELRRHIRTDGESGCDSRIADIVLKRAGISDNQFDDLPLPAELQKVES